MVFSCGDKILSKFQLPSSIGFDELINENPFCSTVRATPGFYVMQLEWLSTLLVEL